MVVLRTSVHKRGLGIPAQSKVFALRNEHLKTGGKRLSWEKIAPQVLNLEKEEPGWQVCRDSYNRMNSRTGHAKSNYKNCGKKATVTPALRKWIVSRLLLLRKTTHCTSAVLQRELAKTKHVRVEASTVRRALKLEGYWYLNRSKKPKYNKKQRKERLDFADVVMSHTAAELEEEMNLSLDGVVFTKPPDELVARENFCYTDLLKIWRKPEEVSLPEIDGHDDYKNQVPPSRMIPLWGGLAAGGFAPVLWHENRKTDAEEWAGAIKEGALQAALRAVNPGRRAGPWTILCDNEAFLRAPACRKLYSRLRIELWKLPARSPDLNPIEKMWGWTRKRLNKMDLADLVAGRPVPGKMAYTQRLKRLLKTQAAQRVAKAFSRNLRTVAARVQKAKGAAVKG